PTAASPRWPVTYREAVSPAPRLTPFAGRVAASQRQRSGDVLAEGRSWGVDEPLEQLVVAPLPGDVEVARRQADEGEPGAAQHRLGGEVVDQRGGLEAV